MLALDATGNRRYMKNGYPIWEKQKEKGETKIGADGDKSLREIRLRLTQLKLTRTEYKKVMSHSFLSQV